MFEVDVNGLTQRYRTKPTMNVDISGSSASIPKPLTYDYMPEGYPKKDGWSIVWDGNTEGKVVVDIGGDPFCKISDMVLSDEDLLSATITFTDNPGEEVPPITSDNIQVTSDDVIFTTQYPIIITIVRKDNADVQGITFPEKGVYAFLLSRKFKMSKENITPMSTDFMPKNLNVVFRGETGNAPTSCNVTYDELRDWVERGVPVFSAFIYTGGSQYVIHNITIISLLTDGLGFGYYDRSGNIKAFKYKSDGTITTQPNHS